MPKAIFTTPHGDINVTLFPKTAPGTVENFIKLAKSGYYEQLSFHRVIENFMIQGGCPNSKAGATGGPPGNGGPGYTIKCEVGPSNPEIHTPGTLSMAKTPAPNSGGSQFFITHVATPHLNGKHTVFGRVDSAADLKIVFKVKMGDRFSVKIID